MTWGLHPPPTSLSASFLRRTSETRRNQLRQFSDQFLPLVFVPTFWLGLAAPTMQLWATIMVIRRWSRFSKTLLLISVCCYGYSGVGRFACDQRRLRVHCSDCCLCRACIVDFAFQAAFCLLALRLCAKSTAAHSTMPHVPDMLVMLHVCGRGVRGAGGDWQASS